MALSILKDAEEIGTESDGSADASEDGSDGESHEDASEDGDEERAVTGDACKDEDDPSQDSKDCEAEASEGNSDDASQDSMTKESRQGQPREIDQGHCMLQGGVRACTSVCDVMTH